MKYFFKLLLWIAIPLYLSACSDSIEESQPLVDTIKSKLSSTELISFTSWLDDGSNEKRLSEALHSMALQSYPDEDEELEYINRFNERLSSYTKYVILDNYLQSFYREGIVVWDRPGQLEEILSQLPESIRAKVDRTISEHGFTQIQTFITLADSVGVSSAFTNGLIDVFFTPEENSAIATLDANRPNATAAGAQAAALAVVFEAQAEVQARVSEIQAAAADTTMFKFRNGMSTPEFINKDKIGDFCALLVASKSEISSVEEIYKMVTSSGVWSGSSIELFDDLSDDELVRGIKENPFMAQGLYEIKNDVIDAIKVERQGQGISYDRRRCSLAASSVFKEK